MYGLGRRLLFALSGDFSAAFPEAKVVGVSGLEAKVSKEVTWAGCE